MAQKRLSLSGAPPEGNRKYIVYAIACFSCVCAGAYIGHTSQMEMEDIALASSIQQTSAAGPTNTDSDTLEIKYAYFGASPVQMPSEKDGITTEQTADPVAMAEQPEEQLLKQALLSQAPTQAQTAAQSQALTNQPLATKQLNQPASQAGSQIATVSKGDSFSTIGQRYGLSAREAANIMLDKQASEHLNTIIPGEQITFEQNDAGKVEQIVYVIDDTRTLVLDRTDEAKFTATLDEVALERRTLVNMGVVENSLFLSAAEAGVSNRNIMQMVDIFRWDIDFAMDVQPGDSFKLVYEGFYKGEQMVRTGKLLGVEFKGRSTHQALYFEDSDGEGGYYTPRGRQLEKQFLRNPVDTVRITSPFNLQRKHPVLNTIKAHKGVDYGAPTGTPIKATADGIVKYSGRRGTYGLTVELQHGKRYTTLYAHMSKIHPSSGVGKKVKQGQIIGYVGKTGRVTGAHLHYEFRVKGVHVNPQTVKFAGAGAVSDEQLQRFKTATGPIMEQLTRLNPNRFALSQ